MRRFAILFILCMFLVVCTTAITSAAVIDGLSAYWSFNESTGTNATDIIRNFNISVNTTWNPTGVFATGGIEMNTSFNIASNTRYTTNTTDMAINFWINKTIVSASVGGIMNNLDTGNAPNVNGEWRLISPAGANLSGDGNNQIMLDIQDSAARFLLVLPVNLTVGRYRMFTLTFNNTHTSFFVDGVINATYTLNNFILANRNITIFTDSGMGTTANARNFVFDEFGIWNRTLNSSEIVSINSSVFPFTSAFVPPGTITTTLISPANGSSVSTVSTPFVTNYTMTGLNLSNGTYFVWRANGTLFNQTSVDVNGTINSTTLNIALSDIGRYSWNTLGCARNATVTSCNFAPANFTFIFGAVNTSTFYNPITFQGQEETFIVNVTVPSGSSFSATLVWNNTNFPASIVGSGTNYTLIRNITIPSIIGLINWTYKIDFSNGFQQNVSTSAQDVRVLTLDDCSAFTNQILNFSLYDEDARARLNGTIEALVELWNNPRTSIVGTFNRSYTVNETSTARVCLDTLNNTLSMDYQTKYYGNTSTYAIEYKFARNIALTNTTAVQNVPLYSLLDSRSTPFVITLQSADLSIIEEAIIDVQRQYIPINQFISVESPLTNNNGEAIAHLVHNDVYYNFLVTLNGTTIGTFNNYLVQCANFATGDCKITLNLVQSTPALPDFENYGNITGAFTWQPSTRNLFFSFSSTDGNSHNVSWNVLKLDNFGNNSICQTSAVSTTGTFQCTVPTLYGNSSILAKIYSDGIFIGQDQFSLQPSPGTVFGGMRVILAILMYATITLMMIGNPAMTIIGAIMGMLFAGAFRLVDGGSFIGNASIVMWFIIAGWVIIHYMRKGS